MNIGTADCGVNHNVPSHAKGDTLYTSRRHRQAGEDTLSHECEETQTNARNIYTSLPNI